MPIAERTVTTSHAEIAVADTGGSGLPVLFIHGNSASRDAFRFQMESPLRDRFRLIAADLPGHGRSGDAFDPEATYSMHGYADAMAELLAALGIERAVVCGWSLGGHVALEMVPRWPGLVGLMIMATPAVSPTPESVQSGFRPHPAMALVGKAELSDSDVELFADTIYGAARSPGLVDAIRRTDGRARAMMFGSIFTGKASDQRAIAESTAIPLAVVNGAEDPLVDTDYVGRLGYRNLWERHCFLLRGQGHAPFLTAPAVFNAILARFLGEMARRAVDAAGRIQAATAVGA